MLIEVLDDFMTGSRYALSGYASFPEKYQHFSIYVVFLYASNVSAPVFILKCDTGWKCSQDLASCIFDITRAVLCLTGRGHRQQSVLCFPNWATGHRLDASQRKPKRAWDVRSDSAETFRCDLFFLCTSHRISCYKLLILFLHPIIIIIIIIIIIFFNKIFVIVT